MTLNKTAYSPQTLTAVLCGLADSSVWISFLLPQDFVNIDNIQAYYILTIAVKCILILIRGFIIFPKRRFFLFVVPVLMAEVLSVSVGLSASSSFLLVIPFVVSLLLTVTLLRDANCRKYFQVVAFSVFVSIVIFLEQLITGNIESSWGRWLYFNGSHPNLGGEVIFAGVLAAAISTNLRSLYFIAYFLLAFGSVYLLEARSAMLAILSIGLVASYFVALNRIPPMLRVVVVCAVITGVVVLLSYNSAALSINEGLLLDNEYRGWGTGFVGRQERWAYALETFRQNFLFGVGFGYFREESLSDVTPHNFWLHMLSEMGLLSAIAIYSLADAAYSLFKRNRAVFIFCSSALFLTMFNDRFINMNPYPFGLFVILFLPESAWEMLPSFGSLNVPAVSERVSARHSTILAQEK